jgi:hypothetical protein
MTRGARRMGRRGWLLTGMLAVLAAAVVIVAVGVHARDVREDRQQTQERVQVACEARERHHRQAIAAALARRSEAVARRDAQEPIERWRSLQHDLVGTLVLEGGAEAYERISGEAETKGRAYAASEIRALADSLSTTRAELATIAEHSQPACAAAIENARALLKQRQSIVEQTRRDSMASEYGWATPLTSLHRLSYPRDISAMASRPATRPAPEKSNPQKRQARTHPGRNNVPITS